jgi:hypothetical protein
VETIDMAAPPLVELAALAHQVSAIGVAQYKSAAPLDHRPDGAAKPKVLRPQHSITDTAWLLRFSRPTMVMTTPGNLGLEK